MKNICLPAMVAALCLMLLAGCGGKAGTQSSSSQGKSSDSASGDSRQKTGALSVVLELDLENRTIVLQNVNTLERSTLAWSGATDIRDRYDQVMAMGQVAPGEMVEATFSRAAGLLQSMHVSDTAWESTGRSHLTFDEERRLLAMDGRNYKFGGELAVFSGWDRIELREINEKDQLTVRGYGNTVYSILVTRGHGYISLDQDADFIGGWIEVGSEAILPITENMLILVPVGTYKVSLEHQGYGGSTEVLVGKDEESVIDASALYKPLFQTGQVTFQVAPAGAKLLIDGREADYSQPVTLRYGIHTIAAEADGYSRYAKMLFVNSEAATLSINLEQSGDSGTSDSSSGSGSSSGSSSSASGSVGSSSGSGSGSSSGQSGSSENSGGASTQSHLPSSGASVSGETVSGGYKIRIESPEDAEIYFDGVYMGKIPAAFQKTSGTHTITLRQAGYVNKSVTVVIDKDQKDVTFAFPALEKVVQ